MSTAPARCGGCSTTWTGDLACHCSACHITTVGERAFMKHRTDSRGCIPREELAARGLFIGNRGLWTTTDPGRAANAATAPTVTPSLAA